MEWYSIVLLALVALFSVASFFLLMKQGRHETLDGEELKRMLSEQKDEVLRQIQVVLSEQEDDILRQIQMVREELMRTMRELLSENRMELSSRVEDLRKEIAGNQAMQLQQIQETLNRNLLTTNELQREKLEAMTRQQEQLVKSTEKRLDDMRLMVEEKLQKTLNERIGQSFELVRTQLENVQQGLGEMKNLAQDVGGLKRVLTNVKTRGTFGEVQLAALLEQMLSPEQYEANVKTKQKGTEFVEFAVKLPGKDDGLDCVYLPIDAKFPKDAYEQYLDAYESGNVDQINATSRQLEQIVKKMARDIRDKYIEPPYTTDFGIMFLPFENIYAEVIRRTALVEQLQREHRVIVTGPTTLGAILNSLQMGFRTLAIEKRSSEVWTVLAAVKTEFGKFGGMLEKVQKNLESAGSHLEEVLGKRTKAIERKLKTIQELPTDQSANILAIGDVLRDDDND